MKFLHSLQGKGQNVFSTIEPPSPQETSLSSFVSLTTGCTVNYIGSMNIELPNQIREFFAACRNPYSYNLRQNLYIWFGIFWGLPIPLVTIFLEAYHLHSVGESSPFLSAVSSPLQWLFLAHPLLFGTIFGILGTIRFEKDQELALKINQLNELSIHDALTGLKNRRYFSHIFHDECARSLRKKEKLTLLFLDIDFFKQVNDTHGHYVGDIVLRELGHYLKHRCRPYDTAVRWGGEEFLILLPATDERGAALFAERVRAGVESGCSTKITFPLTVSIGIAEHKTNDTLEQMTDRADQALYYAKQTGRNRVVQWSTLEEENDRSQP